MTYIDLMNRFHRFKRQYKFSHLEVHIWLELAQFWNEAGRPDFVTLTERSLCGLANTTLSKLKEACNFFREIGLIEVRRTESKRGCRFYLAPNCPGTDAGTKTDASSAHPQTPAHLTQNARKKGSKKGWKTGSFLPGKPSGTKAFTMPQRREEKRRRSWVSPAGILPRASAQPGGFPRAVDRPFRRAFLPGGRIPRGEARNPWPGAAIPAARDGNHRHRAGTLERFFGMEKEEITWIVLRSISCPT